VLERVQNTVQNVLLGVAIFAMNPAIDEVVITVLHLAAHLNGVLVDFKESGAVTEKTHKFG
jgi:hypothetical protein